jgi:hypothetical protein
MEIMMSDVIVTYDFSGLVELLAEMFPVQTVHIHNNFVYVCGLRNSNYFDIYFFTPTCYMGQSRWTDDLTVENILDAALKVCSRSGVLYKEGGPRRWSEVEEAIVNWWESYG